MDEKKIYLIAELDEASNKKLAGIYDRLFSIGLIGEQTKGIPYHFTLGSFAPECQKQVFEHTQEICSKTKAFEINLGHIGLFGLKVLFIAPSINIELLKLYGDLTPDKSINGVHNWVAHATMLIDSPVNIKTAIPIVSEEFTPFTATVARVSMLEFPPVKIIKNFELSP